MIKGHVAIELHNHKTGLRDRIEGDNMITNALNYVIPIVMGGNTSAERLMPLCKKALGSLMLFDGTLTEDKNNMFLPAEAHLVAFADRGLDTTHSDRGSLNSAETYQTDTGYQSVWDFSTSQANGTIKSLALSLNYSSMAAISETRLTILLGRSKHQAHLARIWVTRLNSTAMHYVTTWKISIYTTLTHNLEGYLQELKETTPERLSICTLQKFTS